MCFNKPTWCDSANMSRLTNTERTGCDARITIQMRPANQHLCDKWFTFFQKWKIPTGSRKRYLTPHTYSRGALQQILQVAAMKIKRIALDMNESRSVTRPTGHMGILRVYVFAVFRVRYGGAMQCHLLAMWHFLPSLPGYVNVWCWAEHCAIVGTQGSICGKSAGRTAGSVSDSCGGRTAAFIDRCSCVIGTSWALYPSGREALLNIVWPQWWQRAHNKQCCGLTQLLVTRFQGHLGSKSQL